MATADDTTEHAPTRITDPLPHAELCMLYVESTETIRFVKNFQWKTVGATLLTFLSIIFIAGFSDAGRDFGSSLMAITILLCAAAIFTLIIYQFWMHNEHLKLDALNPMLSPEFRAIRAIKSRREAILHRYTLLSFMVIVILLGGLVVWLSLREISGL